MRKLTTFIFLSLLIAGCNLEEINENPNVPLDVPLNTLLPPAQKALANAQGGRIFRYTGIFGKQLRGVEGQELLIQNYQPDEIFVSNPWQDIYVGPMINLKIIIDRASETSPHYAGVARILMVQSLGTLTDIWGDVPYTEALRGGEIDHPIFDSQQEIYNTIFALLDRATADLASPNSVFSPGADDLMYGGDLNRWTAAAAVMQARYAMRTTKRDPNAAAATLEALMGQVMDSPNDDLKYDYLGTGDETNPIAGFYASTPLAYMNAQYMDILEGLSDPRMPTITRTIPLSGGNRKPGDYWSTAEAPVRLVTYIEQEFLRAEAHARLGNPGDAQQALENAVRSSMDEVSAGSIDTDAQNSYIAEHLQLGANETENLRIILTQKFIAMLTTPEPWADWRRTGFPELMPNPDGVTSANPNGEIPRRLIYPQSERLRNNNFPLPAPNMQTRFWWDEE